MKMSASVKLLVGIASLVLIAVSCATSTPYQPTDGRYGYSEQRIEENRYRVTFNGNESTPRTTVENFLLFRAAELTLDRGFDYFVIVEQETETTSRLQTVTPPVYGYYSYGFRRRFPYYAYGYPWAYDITAREVKRYEAIAFIVMYQGEKPEDDPQAYDARDVSNNLRATVVSPQT